MLFRTLVHRSGPRASHLIACRASREAILVDPHPDDVDRYVGLLEDLDLDLRAVISSTPITPATASGIGSYNALLDDLGLETAAATGTPDLASLGGLRIAPLAGEAGLVQVRYGERTLVLARPTGSRARVADLAGEWPGEGPWDCAVLPVGDVRLELWASPTDAPEIVIVLPDRALTPDAGRLAEALGRLPDEVAPALGIRPWTLLCGNSPSRGPLLYGPNAPRTSARRRSQWSGGGLGDAPLEDAAAGDTRWMGLGAPHPDGYRQLHPIDAWAWLDRLLVVEVSPVALRRHLPGTCAVETADPGALVAALAGGDRAQPVLVVSEYGYDCRPFARRLVSEGFGRVFHLKGGLHRWRQNELPTTATVGRLASLDPARALTVAG